MNMACTHLHLLTVNEHWQLDGAAGVLRRVVRQPKSLKPYLYIIVDDLRRLYSPGVRCVDASIRKPAIGRRFRCKAVLLYWTGDYPGQAAVSGTHSKVCHWCTYKSSKAPEINRRAWTGYRRYLPEDHPVRGGSAFYGPAERGHTPACRTHAEYVADGKDSERHDENLRRPGARSRGCYKKDHPAKTTGVKELSPLALLLLFDLVWDILPDWMHIMSGIWKRHIFQCFRDTRQPAPVKPREKWSAERNAAMLAEHKKAKAQLASWSLATDVGAKLDERTLRLAGEKKWVRSGLMIHSHGSALNSHDWLEIISSAGDYVLADVFPDERQRMDALLSLVLLCDELRRATSAHDSENRDVIDRLKLRVVEVLCKVEAAVPKTELAVMFHIILHVPDCIYRWNSLRNWWNFFGERCMGYFIRFIHNRDLAGENILTAYVRHRVVMGAPAGAVHDLVGRLNRAGFPLPTTSLLLCASQLMRLQTSEPGRYTVAARPSRRNARELKGEDKVAFVQRRARSILTQANMVATAAVARSDACTVFAMVKGVQLNGREFAQGDHVEYVPRVRVRANQVFCVFLYLYMLIMYAYSSTFALV
jgi:hypothetical protein